MKIKASQVLFESMNWAELKSVAKVLKITVGKNKAVTMANLTDAVAHGKAGIKLVGYISAAPAEGSTFRPTVYIKKLRTYKDDKVVQPVNVSI